MTMNKTLHIISILLILIGVAGHAFAQEPEPTPETPKKPRVMILGNVYGGGELAQVVAPTKEDAAKQLIQDADLSTLFTIHTDHVYTTYLHLGGNSEVYGQVFGGGMGQEDTKGESAGRVTGQTDVALDGATVWSEIFGGGQMADVRGNTLVHFVKGKAGHNAFGGGLGVLGKRDVENKLVPLGPDDTDPDNRYEPLASADIKLIPANYELITEDNPTNIAKLKAYYNQDGTIKQATDWMSEKKTGESFVVFDGEENSDGTAIYTHYEFEKARTVNRDENGNPQRHNGEYYIETDQFDASQPEHLFSIDHNIYGGGMTASKVDGKTFVHVNYGMVDDNMMDFEHEVMEDEVPVKKKVWDDVYNSIANAQFCVFGGGYGYHTDIYGDANVTFDIEGSGNFTYGEKFREAFIATEPTWTSVEDIQTSANNIAYSHGAPGRSCMDIVGGGYNGRVLGTVNVTVGGDVVVRKVYGGGYYSSVGNTKLDIKSGIFNRIYGGGMIGNVYGVAQTTIGQKYSEEDETKRKYNAHLIIKNAVYGGNDVSGTVGTTAPGAFTHTNPETLVTYNVYSPVDDETHGVRLNLYGGLVIGDVYGAGNGNHTGYTNPDHMQFSGSQHPSENYRQVQTPGQIDPAVTSTVYKYRPRTARVEMTISGNEGESFADIPTVDKVRIWGRTFGGGNSCNVGIWDGEEDDNAEVYASDASSWHPGDNFKGGGTIKINVGSHVQFGNRNDSHDEPNGLFMGSNGQEMVTQTTDPTQLENYHHYFNPRSHTYLPGFLVYDEAGKDIGRQAGLKSFAAFINNIITWSDNVKLNIDEDATDVWMSNFVGGGYRGSMKAKTAMGKFDYKLPEGVTVGHAIVGGSYNSHIVYRIYKPDEDGYETTADGHFVFSTTIPDGWNNNDGTPNTDYYLKALYEDQELPEQITAILRYNFNGGMLSENSTGITTSEPGHRIHSVHADPRADESEYATAYFEPLTNGDNKEDEATKAKLFTANKERVLVHLDLKCALHPLGHKEDPVSGTPQNVHGGIVYGGCYMSGFVEGDSWVDYGCYLSPLCNDDPLFNVYFNKKNNLGIYGEVADLDRNNAMNVFGAGFGEDTHSMGDVYLYIKSTANSGSGDIDPSGKFPYIFNAFGGSNMGEVDGNVNVYYEVGNQGTLLGSLYGGSYKGKIGGNTFVELAAGFVTNVYGGSRQADIMGASHVWAYDGQNRGVPNSNHLIISNIYGGNDVAGTIHGTMPAAFTAQKWDELSKREKIGTTQFNTYVEISADDNSTGRGFPLIGSAYAGGNGQEYDDYAKNFDNEHKPAAPEVKTALIEIDGGATLRAFGGGNKATVTGSTYIFTNATQDSYASVEFSEYQKNIMQKVFFNGVKKGYKWEDNHLIMDPFHVMNLFGGNNLATMDIQPTWNLAKGRIENVYSGGNMGDMTYYNPNGKPATKDGQVGSSSGVENNADLSNSNYTPRGLSITIDSPDIFINSLFGGCRLSDVRPDDTKPADYDEETNGLWKEWPTDSDGDDYYGATVNITDGYINNVYGGNDISGTVYHGTNVNISGAVSGNVYGSGNGFYLYKYDADAKEITEEEDEDFGIYYRVPEKKKDGNLYDLRGVLNTDTHKILTINEARPSVEKAFLNIGGLESYTDPKTHETGKRVAYVKGNVFCGGNASTVTGDGKNGFTKFKIGSYVTLNGVFMGSDGLAFTDNDEIANFAKINGITDMGAATAFKDGYTLDQQHNPILLNTYMMAVDMLAQPRDFNLNLPLKEAHIGTYCGGGNRGSMLVDKTVELPFHHDIIIYDKIVGACLNSNVQYNQNGTIITSYGGYTRAIDLANNGENGNTKMRLNIASQFVPLVMDVPADKNPETKNSHDENFEKAKEHDFLYDNRTEGVKYTYEEFNELFEPTNPYTSDDEFFANESEDHWWKEAPGIYAPSCNIYGGCYQSGEVEGDIELNLYSNMLRYVDKEDLDKSLAQNIACFNVYGAGFGQNSHVWGNVKINMDRSLDTSTMGDPVANSNLSEEIKALLGGESNWDIQHSDDPTKNMLGMANAYQYPSFNNIIGGGRNGKLIGNSTVEIRNGLVYSDVAGGCYASDMYGSTHVIVGYPQYWVCNASGEYTVQRGDSWNTDKKDFYGHDLITKSIKYLKGDLVPDNVYKQIVAANSGNASKFTAVNIDPTTRHASDGTTWDDIHIKIGKGVYGGGYSLANSTAASAGSITTNKLTGNNIDKNTETHDLHDHNFNTRGYGDIASTVGFGGNSSIMVGDMDAKLAANSSYNERDHIHISSLKATKLPVPYTSSTKIGKFVMEGGKYTHQGDGTPDAETQYYELTGDGGMYGDGHLTFCEGFRAADVTRYGWAEGTAKHPVLLNTFQRMDLLSVNDCCLMLQGAQDFATDQIDATLYSITRINELRMNSTLDAGATLGQISSQNGNGGVGAQFDTKQQRNYLAFFNNVHYLGSIVTNDDFADSQHTFHDASGALGSKSYKAVKQDFINTYSGSSKDAAAVNEFKKRNVATARNAIGINNGYCLRVQNQEYDSNHQSQTYYGPVVGVCEVKLLTLVQGEGGGYVYADNIHADENNFLMTSGNFVFPGIVSGNTEIGDQYIVDDCFLDHFGTPNNITQKEGPLDEAHYWYVEGNKYFFTTTLTGFTYQEALDFNLIENDPNIILSGMENGSQLNIKKIEWVSTHRTNYEPVLPNDTPNKIDDYEFDIEVGGTTYTGDEADWHADMPRHDKGAVDPAHPENYLTTGLTIKNNNLPQFNIRLQDKLDNSGDLNYDNHLDEPEVVKIYLEGKTKDEHDNWQTYEYTITLNIVYLQGPTFEGGVKIENCALPGEWIGFSSDGLKVKTPELMPITAASWQIVPLKEIDEHGVWHWDITKGTVIPVSDYTEDLNGDVSGHITALYKQNEYNIAYIFTAGGHDFPVMPNQNNKKKEERMIVVHNYHRMNDVLAGAKGSSSIPDLQIEAMPEVQNNSKDDDRVEHAQLAEAKLYIEDEEDLRAFVDYLNMATEDNAKNIPVGLTGLDIILQKNIQLTKELPAISQVFAGNFHGDGYHIDLNDHGSTFLGSKFAGNVYNLGLVGGTIASTGTRTNCYEYEENDAFTYGKMAYDLSHHFTPTADGYVEGRYANGDYQYATTDRIWSLRTDAPNYGRKETKHDMEHKHDDARWMDTDDDGVADTNVPLYDGTNSVADKTVDISGNGTEFKTYYGLPVGYTNDYLFFGQHLDNENSDAYPVHIEDVAKGDAASDNKGGNRVYETSGYYHSGKDQKFYYNKDACALQTSLTAIDFSDVNAGTDPEDLNGRTAEGDKADNKPAKFSKNTVTGKVHPEESVITNNLLVYSWLSDNNSGIFNSGIYDDIREEADITYHTIGSDNKIANFHLVDKQCFNAPIAFEVTNRAWYERMPDRWRNVGDVSGYTNASAWEGICLPFTARQVTAKENGVISHFYGEVSSEDTNDRTLHHEYWLTGFKEIQTGKETTATFARPSKSGAGLFVNAAQSEASYGYSYPENRYFTSLVNYTDYHDSDYTDNDSEDGDEWVRSDAEWYKTPHTFADYTPITASVPYLIAFPGNDFYEFSMEGSDYDRSTHTKSGDVQLVTFENNKDLNSGFIKINVSDAEISLNKSNVNDYNHAGTYMGVISDDDNAFIYGINSVGSAFTSEATCVLPFRTYMTRSDNAPQTRSILISDGYITEIGEESEKPEDEMNGEYLRIWNEGLDIIVETSKARTLNAFTSDGVHRGELRCDSGVNRFRMETEGFYFVGKKKLYLKEF